MARGFHIFNYTAYEKIKIAIYDVISSGMRRHSICKSSKLKTSNTLNFMIWQVNSNEIADEIEAFFASGMNPSIVMNLKLSVEQIRIKARWIQSVRQEHSLPDLIKHLAQRK